MSNNINTDTNTKKVPEAWIKLRKESLREKSIKNKKRSKEDKLKNKIEKEKIRELKRIEREKNKIEKEKIRELKRIEREKNKQPKYILCCGKKQLRSNFNTHKTTQKHLYFLEHGENKKSIFKKHVGLTEEELEDLTEEKRLYFKKYMSDYYKKKPEYFVEYQRSKRLFIKNGVLV
jgi:hypothetical protein